ncbi:MAG: MoaF N-terminal domain-containing protein [Gammaproteobacteria bacterium]|nr:MoaF N-terminal domain-containing protein [Gammaproteobacteria bacterium]
MANRLPSTDALAGEAIQLLFDDGATMSMALTAGTLRWAFADRGRTAQGEDAYDAVEMRPGVFFLDFAVRGGPFAFSHVIDREHGRAITVWNELTHEGGERDLRELLRPARLAGHAGAYEPIGQSRDLLGRRVFCEYSREAALEHLYVNSRTLVWQWLLRPPELEFEVGVEAVGYWKIRDELFLLASRGEDPIGLTLLMDFDRARNVGRLFGQGACGIVDRRCGARITFLGAFSYPPGYQPG